jgi:hypothetical protein
MALTVPLFGVVEYNGYQFSGAIHVQGTSEGVRDEADRTVLYVKHTITVDGVICAPDVASVAASLNSTDLELQDIRRRLTRDGGKFVFTNMGLGDDLVVNANDSGVRDVKWGPKPRMVKWLPIAGHGACELTWEIVVCVPMCNEYSRRYEGIMSINYGIEYNFDRQGNCTRTTRGHLAIAQTRPPGGLVPDSADVYLDSIIVLAPLGFRRTHGRSLSLDKSRLDFWITDQQIASNDPYPNFVTNITGNHRVGVNRRELTTFRSSIDLSVELAPGVNGVWAWAVFHSIVSRRLIIAKQIAKDGLFIDDIQITEGLFNQEHAFSLSYRILSGLEDLLTATGLWTPLNTGSDWQKWQDSLAGSMFNRRGNAGLYHTAAADALIDLCDPNPGMVIGDGQQNLPGPSRPPLVYYRNEVPPKERSYAQFSTWVEPERETPVSELAPIQEPEPEDADDGDVTDGAFLWDVSPPSGSSNHIMQIGGLRSYRYRLRGYATRIGHPIPRPRLIAIGGRPAIERHARFYCRKVGKVMGVDVYQAAWDIQYILSKGPEDEIHPPKNPIPPDEKTPVS